MIIGLSVTSIILVILENNQLKYEFCHEGLKTKYIFKLNQTLDFCCTTLISQYYIIKIIKQKKTIARQ
jgi:hypothetical protein